MMRRALAGERAVAGGRLLAALCLLASAPSPLAAQAGDVVARGRARLEAGDWSGALLVLRRGLSSGESSSALHSALARAYSEIGEDAPLGSSAQKANFANALDHARKGVELDPALAQAHLDLAVTLGKIAQVSGAKKKLELAPGVAEAARRAIRLDPDLWQAYHVLGVWNREIATVGGFKKLGASLMGGLPEASLEEAIANLETARRLAPSSIRNSLELGRTYLEADREEEGRAELTKAVRLPPSEPRDRALQREARRELAELDS